MDEFVVCDVCMEVYDGDLRCPRVFSCGHSFCTSCVQKLLEICSRCPTCKLPIDEETLESISINYVLKQMVEKYLCGNADIAGSLISEKGKYKPQSLSESKRFCKVHDLPKCFICLTCNHWVCSDCAAVNHKLCKTLLVNEEIEEMKEETNTKICMQLSTISDGEVESLNHLGHYRDTVEVKTEELQSYQQKIIALKEEISEGNRKIKNVSDLQTVLTSIKEKLEYQMKATNVATSANDLNEIEKKLTEYFSSLQGVVEKLKFYKPAMLQNTETKNRGSFDNKKKLMASVIAGERILVTANEGNITRYGELDVNEGIYMIHLLQQKSRPPTSPCITLDHCLTTMTGRKEWPKKIFLQFSSNGVVKGDVIIRLQVSSKQAAKTVLHMCLFGEKGKSFKGVRMDYIRTLYFPGPNVETMISSYENEMPVPSGVNCEILQVETKMKKWKEGEMYLDHINAGYGDKDNGFSFQFGIHVSRCKEDDMWIPAGQVEKGIEVVKLVYQKIKSGESVRVENCGWVLH